MSYLDGSGKARGFVVEALEEAARREGLTLEWKKPAEMVVNEKTLGGRGSDLIVS